jgi:hypothetical protein
MNQFIKCVMVILLSILTSCTNTETDSLSKNIPTIAPIPESTLEYQYNHPAPQPEYINDFRYSEFRLDKEPVKAVCIHINQKPIWVEGNFAEEIHKAIQASAVIWLDGQPSDNIDFSSSPSIIGIQGDNGVTLGTFGGSVLCVEVPQIKSGLHIIRLEFKNTVGALYTYEQVFLAE